MSNYDTYSSNDQHQGSISIYNRDLLVGIKVGLTEF